MTQQKVSIQNLKENKLVYYIYQIDKSIYGLEDSPKYLVVADKDFIANSSLDSEQFPFLLPTDVWFHMVESGSILAWICACLNKKFIIKEHVKLMMSTNPLQLRHYVDFWFDENITGYTKDSLFDSIINVIFARQIIENHKIVNFKEPAKYYSKLSDEIAFDEFLAIYNPLKVELNKLTDGLLHKELMDRIEAKIRAAEELVGEDVTEEAPAEEDVKEVTEENENERI